MNMTDTIADLLKARDEAKAAAAKATEAHDAESTARNAGIATGVSLAIDGLMSSPDWPAIWRKPPTV